MENSKFHKIANYQYTSEAYLFKGKLESEGVEVFLQNENTINTDPLLSNALGGVKLFVKSEDVMKAKQILDAIPEYSVNDKGELLSCPNCGSTTITMVTSIKDVKSFLLLFMDFSPCQCHYFRSKNTNAKAVILNFKFIIQIFTKH